jgi:CubicO group peptidase (beta-lactamase class C family)
VTDVRFAGVRAAAERHVGDEAVPGLVALVAHGGDVQVEVIGRLSVGGPAVERDSLFRVASMTKPVTGAATMALVDDGLLDLDEPVDGLLPELAGRRVLRRMDGPLEDTVPAERAITTRDLLTFTFGFGMVMEMFTATPPWPVVQAAGELGTIGPPDPDLPSDPDRWIDALGSLPLLAQPGQRWLYNTGAGVLGVLLARAAGEPFPEVVRHRVTEPLGMHDTAFWTDDPKRLATAYMPSPDGLVVWDEPAGKWSRPPAFPDGAAGLLSTADDMLAFARMFLAGGSPVLTESSARAMTSDQLTAEQKAYGGLGPDFFAGRSWSLCQAVADSGAFGWDGGLGTSWLVDPDRDLVVIVLTQRLFESPDAPALHREIQAAAYAATG